MQGYQIDTIASADCWHLCKPNAAAIGMSHTSRFADGMAHAVPHLTALADSLGHARCHLPYPPSCRRRQ